MKKFGKMNSIFDLSLMAFFNITLNGNFHENLYEKMFKPFCRTFLTNRGKNDNEYKNRTWEN